MEKQTSIPSEEREQIPRKAEEARERDKDLDAYDKELADSFPASDPPEHP